MDLDWAGCAIIFLTSYFCPRMETWLSGLSEHGYSILFAAVFLEAVGIPVPAALALLIAGAAAARG